MIYDSYYASFPLHCSHVIRGFVTVDTALSSMPGCQSAGEAQSAVLWRSDLSARHISSHPPHMKLLVCISIAERKAHILDYRLPPLSNIGQQTQFGKKQESTYWHGAVCVSLDLVASSAQRPTGTSKSKEAQALERLVRAAVSIRADAKYIRSTWRAMARGTLCPVTGLCYTRLGHWFSPCLDFTPRGTSSICSHQTTHWNLTLIYKLYIQLNL